MSERPEHLDQTPGRSPDQPAAAGAGRPVALVTGAARGMGLATARVLAAEHHVVVADVGADGVDAAVADLRAGGHSCEGAVCDVTDRAAVERTFRQAAAAGPLVCVVHSAGVSPQMGDAEMILRINALGTVQVTEAALRHGAPGVRVVNVASMAAHLSPAVMMPTRAYPSAATDPEGFVRRVLRRCRLVPEAQRSGIAYSISKNFVVWYSAVMAPSFGASGGRIVSVSPGTFDTEMGRLEEKSGSMRMLEYAALKRPGTPEEIASLLAYCASEAPGYLTGTDILCDGGTVAGIGWRDMLRLGRG